MGCPGRATGLRIVLMIDPLDALALFPREGFIISRKGERIPDDAIAPPNPCQSLFSDQYCLIFDAGLDAGYPRLKVNQLDSSAGNSPPLNIV
jgi:hypothetical protein